MVKCDVKVTEKQVEKVVVETVKEETVVLEMDRQTAEILQSLCGHVINGGKVREATDNLYYKLKAYLGRNNHSQFFENEIRAKEI
jgi:hypothetical protein